MTQPDEAVPDGAITDTGLATYAATTGEDWEDYLNGLITGSLDDAVSGFTAILQQIPIIGDIIEILTGIEDGDLNDLGTWVNTVLLNSWIPTLVEAITGVVDGTISAITNFFTGFLSGDIDSLLGQLVEAFTGFTGGLADIISWAGDRLSSALWDARQSGNLLISPSFEDDTITRYPYGDVTLGYTTSGPKVGTRCFYWDSNSADWNGVYLTSNTANQRYVVSEGDTYRVKGWIKPDSGNNTGSGYVGIWIRAWTAATGGSYTDIGVDGASPDYYNNYDMTVNTWYQLEAVGTVPSGYGWIEVFVLQSDTTASGNQYFLDAWSVREETTVQSVISNIVNAFTGGSGTQVVSDIITQLQSFFSGLFNSTTPQSTIHAKAVPVVALNAGSNLVLDGGFEDSSIQRPAHDWTYTTEDNHGGAQCVRVRGRSNIPEWSTFFPLPTVADDADDETIGVQVEPGTTYYMACWVKGKSSNVGSGAVYLAPYVTNSSTAADNWPGWNGTPIGSVANGSGGFAWTKLYGYVTVPAGYDRLKPVLWLDDTVPTTDYVYVDDVEVREVSAATELASTSFDEWFGGGATGTIADLQDVVGSIKDTLSGWNILQLTSASGTWYRTDNGLSGGNALATEQILEFWVIACGSGSGGGKGQEGLSANETGGTGGWGGRWLARQIDPSTLTSTVSYAVGQGGAGATSDAPNSPSNGADTNFGSYCATDSGITASIVNFICPYAADDARPGSGGKGGDYSSGADPGENGSSTILADGGAGGATGPNPGEDGDDATLSGETRAGGGGGGGGSGAYLTSGGAGGAGGWPGGGGGGGGGAYATGGPVGGSGGDGADGVIILLWRMAQ